MAARGEGPSVRVAQIEVIASYQRFRLMSRPWLGKRGRKRNSGKGVVKSARARAWEVSRRTSTLQAAKRAGSSLGWNYPAGLNAISSAGLWLLPPCRDP
jgi:hypothetical protein